MIDLTKSEKYSRLEALGLGPYVMKKLKVCGNCGHLTKKRAFFCPVCRKRLSGKTLYDRYKEMHICCSVCGIPLAEDTRYCPHCGRKHHCKKS